MPNSLVLEAIKDNMPEGITLNTILDCFGTVSFTTPDDWEVGGMEIRCTAIIQGHNGRYLFSLSV